MPIGWTQNVVVLETELTLQDKLWYIQAVRRFGWSKATLTEEIASAATSTEETGNPVYPPARRKLAEHGISCEGKTARQLTNADYDQFDLLIGMDWANLRNMHRICRGDFAGKLHLLMEYADRREGAPAKPPSRLCGERSRSGMSELSASAGSEGHEACGDDVADPWYTDDFETTWRDVLEGCQGLLGQLTDCR